MVPVERGERPDEDGSRHLQASHDGYRALRIVHARRWRLAGRGDRLDGEDSFVRADAGAGEPVAIRFHLAPGVRASRVEGGAVLLVLPNREAWQFTAEGVDAGLEESVFFAGSDGMRRTEQIVLALDTAATPQVRWRFERLPRSPERGEARRAEALHPML
jgi:uncharacterized heparinase superfamily protein